MSHSDKDRTRKRFARGTKKEVGRDEARLRKEQARQRNQAPRKGPGHPDPTDEDAPRIEKLKSHRGRILPKTSPYDPFRDDPLADPSPNATSVLCVAVYGPRCTVLDEEGAFLEVSVPPGRLRNGKTPCVVGDRIQIERLPDSTSRLTAVLPRSSFLARPEPGSTERLKLIAANVDHALCVVAPKDHLELRTGLIDRLLLALERGGVSPLIVINKWDRVAHDTASIERDLAPYRDLQIPIHRVSALNGEGIADLLAAIRGTTVVLVGKSGVGKSTLVNRLDPSHDRATTDVRSGDDKGRHTTTASELTVLPDGTRVIDTPGVREFGLWRLTEDDVRRGFPDLDELGQECRFRNCRHLNEPDCAVKQAVLEGVAPTSRYASWVRLMEEIANE